MTNSADPDQKPTDLDLHCLQKQDISGFSKTRVKKFCGRRHDLVNPYNVAVSGLMFINAAAKP